MPKNKFFFTLFFYSYDYWQDMKFKPDQCESLTRRSNYSIRCRAKGFYCKTSKKYRCKNHAGLSTGPKTKRGKLRSLQNLKQYRNDKRINIDDISFKQHLPKAYGRKAINSDLPREGSAKSDNDLQMD